MTNLKRRSAIVLVAVVALPLVLAAPAGAHHMTVSPPGHDDPMAPKPVGGGPLPPSASGEGLHVGGPPWAPFFMPAAHSAGPEGDKGLVQACTAAGRDNSAVTFAAPPFFTGCVHGQP